MKIYNNAQNENMTSNQKRITVVGTRLVIHATLLQETNINAR